MSRSRAIQGQESYGRVPASTIKSSEGSITGLGIDSQSSLRLRKRQESLQVPASTTYDQRQDNSQHNQVAAVIFRHDRQVGVLVATPLLCIVVFVLFGYIPTYSSRTSALLFIIGILFTYAFDLCNNRDGVFLSIWLSFMVISISLLSDFVFEVDNFDVSYSNLSSTTMFRSLRFLKLGISISHLFCFAGWETLQLSVWFSENDFNFMCLLEKLLFAILPLTFTASLTYIAWIVMMWTPYGYSLIRHEWIPHIFALSLSFSLWLIGDLSSSFNLKMHSDDNKYSKKDKLNNRKALRKNYAILHAFFLLSMPPIIHAISMRHRLSTMVPSMSHICDFLLSFTFPIQCLTYLKFNSSTFQYSEVQLPKARNKSVQKYRALFDQNSVFSSFHTLHTFITTKLAWAATFVTVVIFHQSYVIETCISVSLYFRGNSYPPLHISMILIAGYACCVLGYCFKRDIVTIASEYADDISEIFLISGFVLIQLAMGIPIQALPTSILCAIAFISFLSTREVLYIIVLALIVGIQSYFLFTFRLTYASASLASGISLFHFNMLCVIALLLLVLTVGFVYSHPTDILSSIRIDIAGVFLSIYSILLSFFEITLISETRFQNMPSIQPLPVYPNYLPLITSMILLMIAIHLKKTKAVSTCSSLIISSVSISKALPNFIGNDTTFYDIMATSTALFTFFAPYAFLQPEHGSNFGKDKTSRLVQKSAVNYTVFILPGVIYFLHLQLIIPVIDALVPTFQINNGTMFSFIGSILFMWGLSATSLVGYILPEGGADSLKKMGVIALFLGSLITFTTKKIPLPSTSMGLMKESASYGHKQSRWGLVVSALAYLLVLTGPLQLKEGKIQTGTNTMNNQPSLIRVMIFSIIFGCGIAWFIALEIMEDSNLVSITLTTISCMVVAFLGTVLTVLGYSLDLRYIREVSKLTKLTGIVFPMFFGVTISSMWTDSSHMFGVEGCLTAYFSVCAIFSLSLTVAMKLRADEKKNSITQELGNLSCFVSWTFCIALVYGQFGMKRIGFSVGILDSPEIFGTVCASFVLLLLEGKSSNNEKARSRFSKIAPTTQNRALYGSFLKRNLFAPPLASIILTFLLATFYVIFLRGCGSTLGIFSKGEENIQTDHEEVFGLIYGSGERATTVPLEGDVASMAKKKNTA